MSSGELVLGLLVGQGAYGVVRRAERRRDDGSVQTVAVKEVRPTVDQAGVPHNAVREIGLLRELRHAHIVNLLDVIIKPEEQQVSLVLEWAEYDLRGVLDLHLKCERDSNMQRVTVLPVSMVRAIMFQLLDATEYLHSQWAMHRDIKPENVLISQDGRIKLADFGLARIFQAPPRPLIDDKTVVTRWYRAPELILGARHYTPAIDVWSLGALFGELILLSPLFAGSKEEPDGMAKDQLLRIFERLGRPDTTVWPTLIEMPFWDQASQWTAELAPCPSHQDGARALRDLLTRRMMASSRKVSPAECNAAINALLCMLAFDPSQRIICKAAKELPFFANATLHKKGAKESLSNVVQAWLVRYTENGLGAVAQLCTLLVRAAGTSVTALDPHEDVESPDADALQQKLVDLTATKYPLASDRAFADNLLSFWHKLFVQAGDVLLDEFLMGHLTVWVEMLSNWEARPFRHVGTAVGLQMISSLIKVHKKSKEAKAKHVAELIETLFQIVFVLRYRDVWPDLRALCIKSLSSWVLEYEEVMMDTSYIKYLGWTLFDPKPVVRLEAVRGLQGLYGDAERVAQLGKFTTRFKGRIGSLPDDKDIPVACAGIRLCALLAKADALDESAVSHIYTLVADKNQAVRAAAGEFALGVYFGEDAGPRQLVEFSTGKSPEHVARALWSAAAVASDPPLWLRDWDAFTAALLGDELRLTAPQQETLAALLEALVAQSVASDTKANAQACASALVNCLHKLLKRFKADGAVVRHVVAMVRHVSPELFATLHKNAAHRKAVELLGEIFADHHDAAVARDSLAALTHLANPKYSLAADAQAVVQRLSERTVAGFVATVAKAERLADDEDGAFALAHSLMLLSVTSRQTDMELAPQHIASLKGLVTDFVGGASWISAAMARDAVETQVTDIMWRLARLLKGEGSASELEGKRDDVLYELEKLLAVDDDELTVAAVRCTTDMLSLFGAYLKKRRFPQLVVVCSSALCTALMTAAHRVLDRDADDKDAAAIGVVVESLCKTIKIHSLPMSAAADMLVHINDDEATTAKVKDLLSTLRRELEQAGKGENEYKVILGALKLAFERFQKSNEYDEDRKVMHDLAQTLVRSYGVVPSLPHKKSMVLLMQEATPYALGLGDAGFVFLKELLMPFTSRMPEPKVMLDFFEKQTLPEGAEESPYYNNLEEFREHLKKLADPTAFKTPLKKKPAAKKVNPRMQLQIEGEDEEDGKEAEARGASTAKKARTSKGKEEEEEEDEEDEESVKSKRATPAKKTAKKVPPARKGKKKTTTEDEQDGKEEEEAERQDEARGASPKKRKTTPAKSPTRRQSGRGKAAVEEEPAEQVEEEDEEEVEEEKPSPKKRGKKAEQASPSKKKRESRTPAKKPEVKEADEVEVEVEEVEDEARGVSPKRSDLGKKAEPKKRTSPVTSSSTKETKKKARTKSKSKK